MKNCRELSLKYLRIQKRRTILTILGIILSVSMISGLQIIHASLFDYWERDARKVANYHGYFYGVEYEKALKIKNHVEIKKAILSRSEGITYIRVDVKNDRYSLVKASDEVALKDSSDGIRFSPLRVKSLDSEGFKDFDFKLLQGRLPKSSDEIVLWNGTFKMLKGINIGDSLKIAFGTQIDEKGNKYPEYYTGMGDRFIPLREKSYKLVGVIEDKRLWKWDSTTAYSFLGGDPSGSYNLYVDMKNPRDTYNTGQKICDSLGLYSKDKQGIKSYRFDGHDQLLRYLGGSRNSSQNKTLTFLTDLITAIIIISTVAVIYNSFNISVIERSSEYGMLRAIGASPRQIRALVLREGSFMAAIGIPLGIISGFAGIKILFLVFEALNYSILKQMSLRIVLEPGIFIISILVSLFTIYTSAMIPAVKAAMVPPIEAMKRVDRSIKIKRSRPSMLVRFLFGPEGEIAYKNLSRNRKRFLITVFSLTLSITLYIAFDSLVNQVLYITGNQLNKYSYSISVPAEKAGGIVEELKRMNNVENVVNVSRINVSVKVPKEKQIKENIWWNHETENGPTLYFNNSMINSFDEDYIEGLRKYIVEGSIDRSQLDMGGVILMQRNIKFSENGTEYVDYTNYKTGDYVEFVDPFGYSSKDGSFEEYIRKATPLRAKVIGIINSMPLLNDFPQQGLYIITTDKNMPSLGKGDTGRLLFIYKKPNTDGSNILKYLGDLQKKSTISFIDDQEIRAEKGRQQMITISILVYGFITLIILISSVNIFNTISSNLFIRKRELGVIKSIGMSQKSLRKMIYLEGFYYGLFSIAIGVITGTGLSYLFYRIFNLSMNVKWGFNLRGFLIAAVGVMAITSLSTWLPLRKLNNDSIIESIRTED